MLHAHELIVDSFAGGGGASLGIEMALGRSPDVAINHDKEAIALHQANHPTTRHYREDVWKVDPIEATGGRPVGLMWLSPDCKHFSKAKGGKPVSPRVRGLAWVAIRWANAVRPRVICLENVEEFQTWGPLVRETQKPCPARRGKHFRAFVRNLERIGYRVEHRQLRGCDYGAPTIRKRLFLVARCDGQPIVWPKPTHAKDGRGGLKPWRSAAECIDWSIHCPSIFERLRPLAENTLKRIAAGLRRYVIESPRPFIVQVQNASSGHAPLSIDAPMRTVTAHPKGGGFALVTPYLAGVGGRKGQSPETPVDQPYHTITAKADTVLVAPVLVPRYGEREGQEPRARTVDAPLATIVPTQNGGQLVSATLVHTAHGEQDANSKKRGRGDRDIAEPLPTTLTTGNVALVSVFLAKHQSERGEGQVQAASLFDPAPTIKTRDSNAIVTATLGPDHSDDVHAFLVAYYGNEKDGGDLFTPMRTVTSKERFGLVTVAGEHYAIRDIGMRMLAARELYRAQGFPDSYKIDIPYNGKPMSKTAQVRMCGNSVCPPVAAAIVRANLGEQAVQERAA